MKVGTTPTDGFKLASFKMIVIVDVEVPSGFTGPVPEIVEFAATGTPPVKTTVPPVLEIGVRSCNVLVSALSDFNVQVATPLTFELEQVVCVFVVPVSVAENVGTVPATALSY